jgi:hypothetical protein
MRGILASLGVVHAGPIGALAGLYGHHQLSAAVTALGERLAAGRVARSLYRSPAQNAAEARFVDQMGRYGMLTSRTFAAGSAGTPAQ